MMATLELHVSRWVKTTYQLRFLWRFDFKRLRRLCLFIWRRRFFLRLPMVLN